MYLLNFHCDVALELDAQYISIDLDFNKVDSNSKKACSMLLCHKVATLKSRNWEKNAFASMGIFWP